MFAVGFSTWCFFVQSYTFFFEDEKITVVVSDTFSHDLWFNFNKNPKISKKQTINLKNVCENNDQCSRGKYCHCDSNGHCSCVFGCRGHEECSKGQYCKCGSLGCKCTIGCRNHEACDRGNYCHCGPSSCKCILGCRGNQVCRAGEVCHCTSMGCKCKKGCRGNDECPNGYKCSCSNRGCYCIRWMLKIIKFIKNDSGDWPINFLENEKFFCYRVTHSFVDAEIFNLKNAHKNSK